MSQVGRLEPVDVRNVWPDEAKDFTPWLHEHPDLLAEALGIDLDMVRREVDVGPFSLDLLASEVGTGRRVVIENQLTPTDHGHLGQLLTYASGLEASYVVWIAPEFRPEHRSALKWMNESTKEGVAFSGLDIEAMRIADSPVAARLNVIVAPDDWSRRTLAQGELTPKENLYQEFWAQFLPAFHQRYPDWSRKRVPGKWSWTELAAGRSGIYYAAVFAGDGKIRAELYVDPPGNSAKLAFAELQNHKEEIEQKFGGPLSWEPLEGRRACRIATYGEGTIEERDSWPEVREWMFTSLGALREALQPFVAQLPSYPAQASPSDSGPALPLDV